MAELRWNPLLKTYTLVNADRQKRPNLPKDWCPFCPGEGKNVPPKYDVYKYDNDFPVLTLHPGEPGNQNGDFYQVRDNYGKCDVILYSDQHDITLPQLPLSHIQKLIDLWRERNEALSLDHNIRYVYIFENRGREVGATIDHPHGQIYAFPYVPQKIEMELKNCVEYYGDQGSCLICDMNKEEVRFGERVVYENASFLVYLPYFTDYPYGVFITAKRHLGNFADLNTEECDDLADVLQKITGAFDSLYHKSFPYMMAVHQTPVNTERHYDREYHFHIEFYPPLRSENRIKYYAASEMGAWAAANPSSVETTAEVLRCALEEYLTVVKENNLDK